jgi:hypothetical protein
VAKQKWAAGSAWLKAGTIAFLAGCLIHLVWILKTLSLLQTGEYYFEILSSRTEINQAALFYFIVLFMDFLTVALLFGISKLGRYWAVCEGIAGAVSLYSAFSGTHIVFYNLNFSNYNDPVGILMNLIRVSGMVCIVFAKDFSRRAAEPEPDAGE